MPFWKNSVAISLLAAGLALGQEPGGEPAKPDAPSVRPAPSGGLGGLEIPDDAQPQPPSSELASYRGAVTRVLAELGESRLVMLPTGALAVAPRAEAAPSQGPFVAAPDEEVVAALAAGGIGKEFQTERAGYYLFAHKCSPAYYQHTRSILESMLAGVVAQLRAWGLEPRRPEVPLVVVIFPNREEFDAFSSTPGDVAAYYNGVSNHVVLYEDDRLFDAAPEYALKQASYVVAHEAIHQLLHNTGVQQRLSAWPAWASEGVPEYFCPLKVHSSLTRLDGDELPVRTVKWTEAGVVNDIRMHDLLRTRPADGRLVRELVSSPGLTAHGYSFAWGVTHYLAERKPTEFAAYLKDVQRLRPLVGLRDAARGPDPLFTKHFGDDYPVLEREVQRHLTSNAVRSEYRDPFLNQTHYVVSVTFKRGRVFYTQAGLALSPTAAREWTTEKKKLLHAEGIDAHVVSRECRDAREAAFQLRKILN